MRYVPPNKIMVPFIILITIGFGLKFVFKGFRDFFQLNYAWHKESVLDDYGKGRLDSVSYNYVALSGVDFKTDTQKTYKLIRQGNPFYFRSTSAKNIGHNLIFEGVEWVTDKPKMTGKTYRIKSVSLPLKDRDGPSVVTLGDDYLIANEAKYYRRDLSQMKRLQFKGSYHDVFNFAHEAQKGAGIKQLTIRIADSVPEADIYIVMFADSDFVSNRQEFKKDTKAFIKALKAERPRKIIWLKLPPSSETEIDKRHRKMNAYFEKVAKKNKIEIIDTYRLLSRNRAKYSRNKGREISRDGYCELAKKTAEILK